MKDITLMLKPASGACNARCTYCFYQDETQYRSGGCLAMMTEETLEIIIQKALARAEKSCTFLYQGGEPTLRGLPFYRRAVELQQKYNVRGIPVFNGLQTNGLCLDDSWADFLSENHFLTGISLDGVRKTHDRFRVDPNGQGTFHRVMDAIGLLKKHGAEFNILTVVNRVTAESVGRIYEFYRKNGFLYQQYIPCLSPFGQVWEEEEYALTAKEYGEFLNSLFDLWFEDWKRGCQPYIRFFENLIGKLLGAPVEACDQNGTCGIQYAVEADGSVYPCDFYMLDAYCIGNFHQQDFPELDQARQTLRFIERSAELSQKCRRCEYGAYCGGGCRRTRVTTEEGDCRSVFCEAFRAFFDHCLPRLKLIAREIRLFRGEGYLTDREK